MQDYSSFNARYNMGLNLENRFCRLAVHCGGMGYCQSPFSTMAQHSLMRNRNRWSYFHLADIRSASYRICHKKWSFQVALFDQVELLILPDLDFWSSTARLIVAAFHTINSFFFMHKSLLINYSSSNRQFSTTQRDLPIPSIFAVFQLIEALGHVASSFSMLLLISLVLTPFTEKNCKRNRCSNWRKRADRRKVVPSKSKFVLSSMM